MDNDGYLDLYIVNGMAAEELFGHLPDNELVEENAAFRNTGDGTFVLAPEWRLGSRAGGRGMVLADMDNDGDLDIVVNNLMAPAQLLENRLCGGDSLEVDLYWPDSGNTQAIGAQVILHADIGSLTWEVRTTSGYLSGDPARLHFGFPAGTQLSEIEIIWPGGQRSRIDTPTGNSLLVVTREP